MIAATRFVYYTYKVERESEQRENRIYGFQRFLIAHLLSLFLALVLIQPPPLPLDIYAQFLMYIISRFWLFTLHVFGSTY